MTNLEACESMILFLEEYYEQTKSDDIGSLLGDMMLTGTEETMDPAIWGDWINAIKKMELKSK